MLPAIRVQPETEVVPFRNAVLCLDCEAVSNSRFDACPACNSRSLVSLSRMLGGSVSQKASLLERGDRFMFDLRMRIDLTRVDAQDLSVAIDGITRVLGPRLRKGKATFHIDVEPATDTASTEKMEPKSTGMRVA
jgi:hypothetical protein